MGNLHRSQRRRLAPKEKSRCVCPLRFPLSPASEAANPAFEYGAPHLSARGTSTLLNNALLSARFLFAASLDRKRLGQDTSQSTETRSEAFSIRRLGGSRWRLRRTRCAMGFECPLAAKSRVGQAPANGKGRVAVGDSVARAGKSVGGTLRGSLSPWGRHTNASMCRSTSQEQ